MILGMVIALVTSKTVDKLKFIHRIKGMLIVFIVSRKFIDLLCDDRLHYHLNFIFEFPNFCFFLEPGFFSSEGGSKYYFLMILIFDISFLRFDLERVPQVLKNSVKANFSFY